MQCNESLHHEKSCLHASAPRSNIPCCLYRVVLLSIDLPISFDGLQDAIVHHTQTFVHFPSRLVVRHLPVQNLQIGQKLSCAAHASGAVYRHRLTQSPGLSRCDLITHRYSYMTFCAPHKRICHAVPAKRTEHLLNNTSVRVRLELSSKAYLFGWRNTITPHMHTLVPVLSCRSRASIRTQSRGLK